MEMHHLKQRQSLPLEAKIQMSKRRIREWCEHWDGDVYVSFSGGKDSTVLLHLVRSLYPDTVGVFCDTGLEFPEVRDFVRATENIIWLKPEMNFKKVIEKHGFPVVSKKQAFYIKEIQTAIRNGRDDWVNQRLHGKTKDGRKTEYCLSKKWNYLLFAPFKISDKCCDVMKKNPFKKYVKETGQMPITGVMAGESSLRLNSALRYGCNAFEINQPQSRPLMMWMESDIWQYIEKHKLPYSKIYDLGYSRTGCMFCAFGAHLEEEPNRFQLMEKTHPKFHKYCMKKLGLERVLKYIGVNGYNIQEKLDLGPDPRSGPMCKKPSMGLAK